MPEIPLYPPILAPAPLPTHPEVLDSISKEKIAELPLAEFEGRIIVINPDADIRSALEVLQKETVLGFDTESRPAFTKGESYPIALIQLSTQNTCYLFRLKYPKMPEGLKALLQNDGVLKIGVGLSNDFTGLRSFGEFNPKGFVDLGEVALRWKMRVSGLRKLAAIFLGVRLSKAAQTSNWEAPFLKDAQQVYAATDAWIALKLYDCFLQQGFFSEPPPMTIPEVNLLMDKD